VHNILVRLEGAGWLTGRWEKRNEYESQGRPRRRYYVLTVDGLARARSALEARPLPKMLLERRRP
jgi:DNA-binding PadR family transcriptional regulator